MKLGVNVDHVATLRQARLPAGRFAPRGSVYPDPVEAALVCQRAGAHAVVMHLREDRRHVNDRDVRRAKRALRIKLNLEMSIAPSVVRTALSVVPGQATLVPERRQERTTEGGLDLTRRPSAVRRVVRALQRKRVVVSLFIDPDARQIRAARAMGAEAVEFHTGDYANARTAAGRRRQLARLKKAVALARRVGLTAHAGHGLDYANTRAVARIVGLDELNIGYSIVARALRTGLDRAVRDMRRLLG
jgi:pyridoxine 5-phosphate synthase